MTSRPRQTEDAQVRNGHEGALEGHAGPASLPGHGPSRADYAGLSELLRALAYPVRLELLDILRDPHMLAEIRVGAHRTSSAGTARRPAAKQTVAAHLHKLISAGLVRMEEVRSAGRKVPTYSVSPPRLYGLIEELRRLSILQASTSSDDLTGTVGDEPHPAPLTGPHFVLVHGVYEGRHYRLGQEPGRFATIGRDPSCTVPLDYDPYVSATNSHIEATRDGLLLRDGAQSKNGTTLNWRRLAPAEERLLRSGDLVGVGRSRLLFLDR